MADILPKLPLAVLLAEKARRNPTKPFSSLEELMTDPALFALTTASNLQRAICRVSDGLPIGDLANDPDVVAAFGGNVAHLPTTKPKEVVALSGIRVGKSLLAAGHCVQWSQTCDVSQLGPGETPRISIVSKSKDLAVVIYNHVVGRIQASPRLSGLLIGQPGAESLHIKHPTGTPIEICIAAGAAAGSTLVARWSAGCVFDEFPRLNGQESGVVNWDDSRAAVLMRILPGGQLLSIGSPWAPTGPAYEVVSSHWGKPTANLVVIKAPGWVMNPHFWTPERVEEARVDPDVFQTDCAGEFASPEESLFTGTEVDGATRAAPIALPASSRLAYRAAMDPATRGNGWSLVIATREGRMKKVAFASEWRGSKIAPLNPRDVIGEIAVFCRQYGVDTIDTDQWSFDVIKELFREHSIHVRQVNWSEKEKGRKYLGLKTKFMMGEIELPPEAKLRADLLAVKRRATTNGVKIILPSSSDGRHCDYVPALLMAMSTYLDDEEPDLESKSDHWVKYAERLKKNRFAQTQQRQDARAQSIANDPALARIRGQNRR